MIINKGSQPAGSASEDESFHEESRCSDESQSQQDLTPNGIRDQMFTGLLSKVDFPFDFSLAFCFLLYLMHHLEKLNLSDIWLY